MEYRYKWLCKYDKIKNQTKYYQLAREATTYDGNEMYFENIDNTVGTFTMVKTGSPTYTPNLEYKVGNGNWSTYDFSTLPSIEVPSGSKIYFRGDNSSTEKFNRGAYTYFSFNLNTRHNVGGYATSLLVTEDFEGFVWDDGAFVGEYSLAHLFREDTMLVSAKYLVLRMNNLVTSCYNSMFYNCTSLTTAPELPATTLAKSCYSSMFNGCTSLTTAPVLPATTLADYCYQNMFRGCTALTTAPNLHVSMTTLVTTANSCYKCMFEGCTKLETAPPYLLATVAAQNCCERMFYDCTSLKTGIQTLPTELNDYCYKQMYYKCTSLTTIYDLPANTLAKNCYESMFERCTSLTKIPQIDAIYGNQEAFSKMFKGCIGLTSVVVPNTTYATYCHSSMFENCTNINNVTVLTEDFDTNDYYYYLYNVSSTGTLTKRQGVNIPSGASGIPSGWEVIEYVPVEEFYLENVDSEEGVFSLKSFNNPSYTPTLEYKLDNKEWVSYTINESVTIPSGSKIYLRGDNETFSTSNNDFYYVSLNANHNVGGYITSLLSKENYIEYNFNENQKYIFTTLFYEDSKLFNANKLVLNSDILTERCYARMFWSCTNLQNAPKLPATTLATSCYYSMFYNCTSLQTSPELPATTLAQTCYNYMFNGCSKLTSVTILVEEFISGYCSNWLEGVSSTGTFTKRQGVTIPEGSSGIPTGWTVIEI